MIRAEPPKSGILVIDKPAGMTSFDVVRRVRSAAGTRRVGHAGTLDPAATGVLVVCLGSATRVVDAIQAGKKQYEATIAFGVTTATYDAEGDVVTSSDATGLTRRAVEQALDAYRGSIMQVPPMYSALKVGGRRLYELAREGVEVERPPRSVTVHRLALVRFDPPEATLEMAVSKGTYVRSLAHDLGQDLGVGAHLSALRRTAVGHFSLSDAHGLDDVVRAFAEGWWPRVTHAIDSALIDLPAMVVEAEAEAAMRHGRQIDGPRPPGPTAAEPVRVYGANGTFVGLVVWDTTSQRWQPHRVFPEPAS